MPRVLVVCVAVCVVVCVCVGVNRLLSLLTCGPTITLSQPKSTFYDCLACRLAPCHASPLPYKPHMTNYYGAKTDVERKYLAVPSGHNRITAPITIPN